MWQYTTAGRVSGIEGDVDRNAFYGSSAEWAKFLATSLPAGNTVIACGVGSPTSACRMLATI